MNHYDLVEHLERQQDFSMRTFGPGLRTNGLIDHIKKELTEIAANPRDVVEWVDVVLLALDGAWRAGYYPEEICEAIKEKLERNMARNWPDWRTADPNKAIEHVRDATQPCPNCDPTDVFKYGDERCDLCHGTARVASLPTAQPGTTQGEAA
ncbi:MAG: DUF550 domain-containing protein [Gammaproteobacteria bacterium]|nr:DUF550 domain-containing protein [Gammaproteobacteria bacterium]